MSPPASNLAFEEIRQPDGTLAGFVARNRGHALSLFPSGASLALQGGSSGNVATSVRLDFVAAKTNPTMRGMDELSGQANYFLGNNPARWRTHVPLFSAVRYQEIYPGVDLVFYGHGDAFEYDFHVAPGADPAKIKLRFSGAQRLHLEADGNLSIETVAGVLTQRKPRVYQRIDGGAREVRSRYVLLASDTVRFDIGDYDRTQPLVIDPLLDYASYLGGSNGDAATRVAVDKTGNMYVAGFTFSSDFPGTTGSSSNLRTAFVAKFTASGTLIYSAYIGGSEESIARDIVVDGDGNAYIAGETRSVDFPVEKPYQSTNGGDMDGFVSVLDATGSTLLHSTYFGGNNYDVIHGIALGPNQQAYLAGETWSDNLPVTQANAFDSSCGTNGNCDKPSGAVSQTYDAFLAVLDLPAKTLMYSTYLGGEGSDKAHAVAVNRSTGYAYLTGETDSMSFPIRNQYQLSNSGSYDAFLTVIAPALSKDASLIYSSYLGGPGEDGGNGVALDSQGHAYIVGDTNSSGFPVKSALQNQLGGEMDAFVVKMNPQAQGDASLVYSTYLGGNSDESGSAIAVDSAGNALAAGDTKSVNFPLKSELQSVIGGEMDGYVAKLSATGSALLFSSVLGGNQDDSLGGAVFDAQNNIYLAGDSASGNFPISQAAYQKTLKGTDALLVRLAAQPSDDQTPPPGGGSTGPASSSGGGSWNLFALTILSLIALGRRHFTRRQDHCF